MKNYLVGPALCISISRRPLGHQQGLQNEMKMDREEESVLWGFLEKSHLKSKVTRPVTWSALALVSVK